MNAIQARARSPLLVLGMMLAASACSGSASEPPASASGAEPASPSASAAASEDDTTDAPDRSIEGHVLGQGEYPSYTVEAPDTWSTSDGHFIIGDGAAIEGVSVWDVGDVPKDPCHWKDSSADPGPTVDDLVQALLAQRHRDASEPVAVTLDGHDGVFVEWSVPSNWVVTGDADFEGCDSERPGGHTDFVSFFGDGFGERYQQVAGQVDMLWILDVDGQRLLVDATYSPDATKADRAELTSVVGSMRFEDAA
jgi:hypothetical protein